VRGLTDDDKLPLLSRRFPAGLKVVLIVIISITLMSIDNGYKLMAPVRGSLAVALQPLQTMAELPADMLDYISRYTDRGKLIERNEALAEKLLLLQGRLQKFAALKAENERMRTLLDSAHALEQDVLIAGILSVSPSPYQHYMMLDKGSLDGVIEGQALIDANGIMGQVVSVTPMSSRAILITDAGHAIPVQNNRTGLRTIVEGTGKSDLLHLPFLPKNANIEVGDLLVTSGLGGRYPANFPVATVSKITHPRGSEFLDVIAYPTARLKHGGEVLLIRENDDKRRALQATIPDPTLPRPARTAADTTHQVADQDSGSDP